MEIKKVTLVPDQRGKKGVAPDQVVKSITKKQLEKDIALRKNARETHNPSVLWQIINNSCASPETVGVALKKLGLEEERDIGRWDSIIVGSHEEETDIPTGWNAMGGRFLTRKVYDTQSQWVKTGVRKYPPTKDNLQKIAITLKMRSQKFISELLDYIKNEFGDIGKDYAAALKTQLQKEAKIK